MKTKGIHKQQQPSFLSYFSRGTDVNPPLIEDAKTITQSQKRKRGGGGGVTMCTGIQNKDRRSGRSRTQKARGGRSDDDGPSDTEDKQQQQQSSQQTSQEKP